RAGPQPARAGAAARAGTRHAVLISCVRRPPPRPCPIGQSSLWWPNDVFRRRRACVDHPRAPTRCEKGDLMPAYDVLRVGVGGPVGSGKTALVDSLCKALRERLEMAVVTNDIYTREDAEFLVRSEALTADRIRGVETGGCPHTAIREDASMNLAAIDELTGAFGALDLIIVESGGDNLAATFSPELSDLTLYVIDVSAGDKIPRKGGPGIIKSDLLIINKIDLAPHVGASLDVMERDARRMRGARPFVFSNLKTGQGLDEIIGFIEHQGMLRDKDRLSASAALSHPPLPMHGSQHPS